MKLNECPRQTHVRLVDFPVEPQFQLRLSELGIRQHATFTTVNRAAFGGMVINIGGARVAVDRASARRMEVEPVL